MTVYYPDPPEQEAVGAVGFLLNLGIMALSLYSYKYKCKGFEREYFFLTMAFTSLCELPRYIAMMATGEYDCSACYALHIVANTTFFVCLAFVALSFARILKLGAYVSVLFSQRGLMAAVAIQMPFNIAAFIQCLTMPLGSFFKSEGFFVFSVFDMVQNIAYTSLLTFYGFRLTERFRNLGQATSHEQARIAFQNVVRKVTTVMCFVTIMLFSRLILLILKIEATKKNESITTPVFSRYGFCWFLVSDFLPRSCTSIAFVILMQTTVVNLRSSTAKDVSEATDESEVRRAETALTAATTNKMHQIESPSSSNGGADDDTAKLREHDQLTEV